MTEIPYVHRVDNALVDEDPIAVVGRDAPLARIASVLQRRQDPAVLLVGDAGSGRSSMLRELALRAQTGALQGLATHQFLELDVPSLVADVMQAKAALATLADVLTRVAALERTVLLVDDVHLLVNLPAFSVALTNDLAGCFRPLLARGRLRVVFTIVPKVFEQHFAGDTLFGRKTTVIHLSELSGTQLREAIRHAARPIAQNHRVVFEDSAIDQAAAAGSAPTMNYRAPGGALRLLEEAAIQTQHAGRSTVEGNDVADVALAQVEQASWDRPRLRALEDELSVRVLAQSEAVRTVSRRLRLTKLGLDRRPQRPDGVFLFLGPSGVGKTELAKALALTLYGDLSRLVRLDMSEYQYEHEYSKMIGAPPGFLGYGDEGHLTGPIARLGHAVVLLDEVEKAHANALRLFLQLFDEGVLTDGKGRRFDFSQCVIVMTSNLGRELWSEEQKQLGFATSERTPGLPTQKAVLEYLLRHFPSEFVNRIDELVPFRAFGRDDLLQVARKMMREEVEHWMKRGKRLQYGDDVLQLLVETGYNVRLGARHLARNIERLVSQPLSEHACSDEWPRVDTIALHVRGDTVECVFDPQKRSATTAAA